ncbi:uncharacterized protein LOC141813098 [Curcuma longa]|uniref:uncharacterized protein LOC141813098 n=1 Tax=Curcuma longa TaxID=136217 RepID=UPI003D9F41A0
MGIDRRRIWCFGVKKKAAMPSIRLGSPRPSWATEPQTPPVTAQAPANGDGWKGLGGRRVVVVVEAEAEAKGTLQWALSHSLQDDDTLVLVAVVRPPSRNYIDHSHQKKRNSRYQMLYALQSICQARRPEIKVEVLVVEGREQGPAIVEVARKQKASLLVLGQKKRSLAWSCIAVSWSNSASDGIRPSSGGDGLADYCIQNASCMTLAVRRKSKRGGYLLTTKHHKDFWLLA